MIDMGKENEVETDDSTTVGLEKQTEEGGWERYEHKRDYSNAVLDEQEEQEKRKMKDPDKIREAIADTTKRPTEKARQRAQRVEEEIRDYLNEARILLRREPSRSKLVGSSAAKEAALLDAADLKKKKLKSLENLWDRQSGVSKRNLNDTTVDAKTGRTHVTKTPSRTLSLPIKRRPPQLNTNGTLESSKRNHVEDSKPVAAPTLSLANEKKPSSATVGNATDSPNATKNNVETKSSADSRPCLPLRRTTKTEGAAIITDILKDSSNKQIVRIGPIQPSGMPTEGTVPPTVHTSNRSRPKRTMSDTIAERISALQQSNASKSPPNRNPSSRMPSRGTLAAMRIATKSRNDVVPVQVEELDHQSSDVTGKNAKHELPNHSDSVSRIPLREQPPRHDQRMTTSPFVRQVPRRNPSSKIASRLRELRQNNAKDVGARVPAVVS